MTCVAAGRPVTARLRYFLYLFGSALLLVGATAIWALENQGNKIDHLSLAIAPTAEANSDVLISMIDAGIVLRGYSDSRHQGLLTPYPGTRARTTAALTTLHDKLELSMGHDDEARDTLLEARQRLAVERWWAYESSAVRAVGRGGTVDVRQGYMLFAGFRLANAAIGEHLRDERDQAWGSARATAVIGTAAVIAASIAALLTALILGYRSARSISRPIIELRDTVTRQGAGETGLRAREDHGSVELRSLAAAFNVLTEQGLALQQAQARALRMHELAFEIERAIRAAPDTQQALDILCAALGEGLGADRVMANTVDADHAVILGAQWHLPDLPPLGDMSDDLVQRAGRLAEELWSSSGFIARDDFLATQVQNWARAQLFHREIGARAVIMVPIGLGDRVVGVIYVLTVHEPRAWTEYEISTVQQVAGFMARVIVEADHRAHQREHIDQLEQLDRQKTDFLSTVSHELRTPLTSISGYLELLQDGDAGELTGEQHRMLEVVDRNTNRLRGLIDDLLELNQIESGGLKVEAVEVSMRELITRIGEEMSPVAHGAAVELDIDAGPEAAIVQGDTEHLHRAVANIVSNAIKFSRPGGVVSISCTLDQGARRVLVTCQDRGIGIPAEDQAHLFTRFYRASNAMDQAIGGTGLGLAIVRQIVEDHGGELRLTSVEGEGTTVVMDLPLSAPVEVVP